ncbi:hypothetical protein [Hafnia alvei]|uniref:Uncharacterized protein n=1 Tax=Hafnia alvei ATCC 51873 TaxID=1002364 RepID=G9YAB4_HAFAL|nr:hypothetical protein [Hafnia alvei]EHM40244.1 hypothetical protein HMPREF0454_03535 [Hafnia alvei ATCC 51873]QQE45330.1 hypothetical protein I6H95_08610 [Hafnia alvei]
MINEDELSNKSFVFLNEFDFVHLLFNTKRIKYLSRGVNVTTDEFIKLIDKYEAIPFVFGDSTISKGLELSIKLVDDWVFRDARKEQVWICTDNALLEKYKIALEIKNNKFTNIILKDFSKAYYEDILINNIKKFHSKRNKEFIEKIEKKAISNKQREVSQRPRNKHYSQAINIIIATWIVYPAASKTRLCKEIHEYFNGGVSENSLHDWIDKNGLQPPRPNKYTSFSLVIPDETSLSGY